MKRYFLKGGCPRKVEKVIWILGYNVKVQNLILSKGHFQKHVCVSKLLLKLCEKKAFCRENAGFSAASSITEQQIPSSEKPKYSRGGKNLLVKIYLVLL